MKIIISNRNGYMGISWRTPQTLATMAGYSGDLFLDPGNSGKRVLAAKIFLTMAKSVFLSQGSNACILCQVSLVGQGMTLLEVAGNDMKSVAFCSHFLVRLDGLCFLVDHLG
ncbi:MAG: hypothetical protein H7833_00860 [Magnetococcus sp. DMHC-1]|nr:hypothetical protein [Magnetococcales bacterium]